MFELKIKVKGDDSLFQKKYLIYDSDVYFDHDSKGLKKIVDEVISEYNKPYTDIDVSAKFCW